MLLILNRWRGTKGYFSHITGTILGLLFYVATSDVYTSIGITVGYVLGESFGWGKWITGVHKKYKGVPTPELIADEDGRSNGIHYLANKINPELKNYYLYCMTALILRGIWWAIPALLPLLLGGYICGVAYIALVLWIGIGFPLSVKMGGITEKYFTIENKYFEMRDFWEHAEVWYGLIQDIAVIAVVVSIM